MNQSLNSASDIKNAKQSKEKIFAKFWGLNFRRSIGALALYTWYNPWISDKKKSVVKLSHINTHTDNIK